MATITDDVVIKLTAELSGLEKGMQKGAASVQRLEQSVQKSLTRMKAAFVAVAGSMAARELVDYAEKWRGVRNQLLVSGVAVEKLEGRLNDLFTVAQRHGADIGALGTLYGRLTQSAAELGASEEEMLRFVDGVGTALKVQGGSAEQASGALLQMSQALGSAIVRAEEFNSINEGARPILQAVANGLIEAGGSVSKLRSLVLDGKVTSQDFFRAFLAGQASIADMAKRAEGTIGQAWTRMQNNMARFIGKMDEGAGTSKNLAAAIDEVSTLLNDPNFAEAATTAITGLANSFIFVTKAIAGATLAVSDFFAWFDKVTNMNALMDSIQGFEHHRADGTSSAPSRGGNTANDILPAPPRHASGGGTGKGSGAADREAEARARAVERYRDVVADLIFELQQLERTEQDAAFQEEYRNRLQAAGVKSTSEHGQAIKELVAQLMSARTATEELRKTTEEWTEFYKSIGDTVASAFGDAIVRGEELSEVFSRLLQQLAEMIFQKMVFDQISGAVSSGISGIVGGFAAGGELNPGNAYQVHANEVIVPRVPMSVIPSGRASGGGNVISINSVVNGAGTSRAEFQQMLDRRDKDLVRVISAHVDDKRRRGLSYLQR